MTTIPSSSRRPPPHLISSAYCCCRVEIQATASSSVLTQGTPRALLPVAVFASEVRAEFAGQSHAIRIGVRPPYDAASRVENLRHKLTHKPQSDYGHALTELGLRNAHALQCNGAQGN